MSLFSEAMDVLEETSRTFFIPISRLPPNLLEAVAVSYLCMRAIDEIEDHPRLDNARKAELLKTASLRLQSMVVDRSLSAPGPVFPGYEEILPEVTLRISDWVQLAPRGITPRILDSITAMAERMAYWAETSWQIRTIDDLDRYTFSVAGAVGLLLSDLWAWHDGTQTNREYAVGFGRGLQAVNILRNRPEDLSRGVDFFPDGWGEEQATAYARYNLSLADAYVQDLPSGPAWDFCKIPLDLAYATLNAMAKGERKLTREEVTRLTAPADSSRP